MKMIILLSYVCFSILYSCSYNKLDKTVDKLYFQQNDGKYDSHFPLIPVDSDIAKIEKTVK